MADWGISPLGNLAQFEVPTFKTGEGLAAILALKQRQQEHAQQLGASIGGSVADAMQQRKKDEMANVLMNQYSKEYGIENPFAGQGEQGLEAASQLIKLRMLAEKQDLAERMGEARISRMGRASTDGGGGGGGTAAAGEPRTWEDEYGNKYIIGPRGGLTPMKPRAGAPGAVGGATGDAGADLFKKYGLKPEELTDVTKVERVNVSGGVATPAEEGSHVRVQGGPVMPFGDYLKYARKAKAPAATSTPPPSVTDAGMGGTESTRVIEKNGHHYEVDDVTKTVIRQID